MYIIVKYFTKKKIVSICYIVALCCLHTYVLAQSERKSKGQFNKVIQDAASHTLNEVTKRAASEGNRLKNTAKKEVSNDNSRADSKPSDNTKQESSNVTDNTGGINTIKIVDYIEGVYSSAPAVKGKPASGGGSFEFYVRPVISYVGIDHKRAIIDRRRGTTSGGASFKEKYRIIARTVLYSDGQFKTKTGERYFTAMLEEEGDGKLLFSHVREINEGKQVSAVQGLPAENSLVILSSNGEDFEGKFLPGIAVNCTGTFKNTSTYQKSKWDEFVLKSDQLAYNMMFGRHIVNEPEPGLLFLGEAQLIGNTRAKNIKYYTPDVVGKTLFDNTGGRENIRVLVDEGDQWKFDMPTLEMAVTNASFGNSLKGIEEGKEWRSAIPLNDVLHVLLKTNERVKEVEFYIVSDWKQKEKYTDDKLIAKLKVVRNGNGDVDKLEFVKKSVWD